MIVSLSIIFGFMIFMLILNKGHLLFINITSMFVMGALSLGVGYGMALFIMAIGSAALKMFGIVTVGIIVLILVSLFFSKRG